MLSEDLDNFAARMRQMADEGNRPTPAMLRDMATVTDVLADSARVMETQPVPFSFRWVPCHDDNVVPLRRFRAGDVA